MMQLEATVTDPAKTIVAGKATAFWQANEGPGDFIRIPIRNIGVLSVGDNAGNF